MPDPLSADAPSLFGLPVQGMGSAETTVFFKLQLIRSILLVLLGGIVPAFAFAAGKDNSISHGPVSPDPLPRPVSRYGSPRTNPTGNRLKPEWTLRPLSGFVAAAARLRRNYSIISLITPAPTVRPPSRMAKRSSFSIAIGVMSSPIIVTLSPGITISTPSGSSTVPVTSVVRK